MRKALAILLVLVILSAGCIITAHAIVNIQRDRVVITENVIYGDKMAAEGLNIERKAQWDERLHWTTDYNIKAEDEYSTEFYFTRDREYERVGSYRPNGISFSMYVGSGMGSSHEITREDISRMCYGYEDLCLDVMENAPAGQEFSEIVQVSDYLDIYPIEVYADLHDLYYLNENNGDYRGPYVDNLDGNNCYFLHEALTDYFRFPVSDCDLVEVRGYKNEKGIVTELDVVTIEYKMEFQVRSTVTPNAVYFAFDCGDDIDFSGAKDGCGIYAIPLGVSFEFGGATYPTADIEGLDMVYPLDINTQIELMFYDEEFDKLVLIVAEDGILSLVSIDPNTMETLQRVEITESSEDGDSVWANDIQEDFIFLYTRYRQVAVIEILENGDYALGFVADFLPTEDDDWLWYHSSSVKAYDGNRLALCWDREIYESPHVDCGFCIAVYDETGLLYYGEYESGLMTGRSVDNYSYYCGPESNGLALEWR